MKLIAEVKTALCQKRSALPVRASPPAARSRRRVTTKLENIKACVDTVKKYGQVQCT